MNKLKKMLIILSVSLIALVGCTNYRDYTIIGIDKEYELYIIPEIDQLSNDELARYISASALLVKEGEDEKIGSEDIEMTMVQGDLESAIKSMEEPGQKEVPVTVRYDYKRFSAVRDIAVTLIKE